MRKLLIASLISLCLISCNEGNKTDKDSIKYIEFTYRGHDMVKFNSTVVHSPECKKCFPRYD